MIQMVHVCHRCHSQNSIQSEIAFGQAGTLKFPPGMACVRKYWPVQVNIVHDWLEL